MSARSRKMPAPIVTFTMPAPSANVPMERRSDDSDDGRRLLSLNEELCRPRLRPVAPEDALTLLDDRGGARDQADLAALVEVQLAQALAADEGPAAVAHDRANVEAAGKRPGVEGRSLPLLLELAQNSHLHALRCQLLQQSDYRVVGHAGIVDLERQPRPAQEPGQPAARILRADDEIGSGGVQFGPGAIGLEQGEDVLEHFRVLRP